MNVLFCYDGPITKGPLGKYYTIGLTNEVLSRYYSFGDTLSLLIRVDEKTDIGQLSKITISPLSVISVPEIKTLSGILKNSNRAKSIIRDAVRNSDFIIVRSPSKIGQLAAFEAMKLKKPYLVEVVAHPFNVLWHHSWKGKLVSFYESYKERKVIKKAPYAIYVTKFFLQNEYPCDGLNIGCADPIIPEENATVLESRLKRIYNNDRKTIIGTIGSIEVKYKGQEYVIKALARLKQAGYDNFEYHLVGSGNPQRLKKIARECGVTNEIKFLGPLPHNLILDFLKNIDIYAQPSLTEGLPRSIVEAMSMATPCIASDCGGISELLDKAVLYNNKGNKEAQIANLLIQLSVEQQRQLAVRNYEWAKKYSSTELDERRESFFRTINTDLKNKYGL